MLFRLFAFGSNSSGQLGIGHKDDSSVPQECQLASSEWQTDERIQDIATGGNHTLLLTSAGRVFAAGSNEKGQCGLGEGTEGCSRFEHIADIGWNGAHQGLVTHIAATWEASFFVLDKQKVYSCGAGSKGELGLGPDTTLMKTPSMVLDLSTFSANLQVEKLSAAMSHVVLLTEGGGIFGWGASRKGQLGKDSMVARVIPSPSLLTLEYRVRSVAVGRDFTFLLDQSGRGHLLGDNKHLGDLSSLSLQPGHVVYAGWTHLFAWSEDSLMGIGRNNHGQLPPPALYSPKLFATGSEHCLAVTQDGRVVAWGWGEHGNCGTLSEFGGSRNSSGASDITLSPGQDEVVSFLAAGCATSFIAMSAND